MIFLFITDPVDVSQRFAFVTAATWLVKHGSVKLVKPAATFVINISLSLLHGCSVHAIVKALKSAQWELIRFHQYLSSHHRLYIPNPYSPLPSQRSIRMRVFAPFFQVLSPGSGSQRFVLFFALASAHKPSKIEYLPKTHSDQPPKGRQRRSKPPIPR